jgi:hypothetical protein
MRRIDREIKDMDKIVENLDNAKLLEFLWLMIFIPILSHVESILCCSKRKITNLVKINKEDIKYYINREYITKVFH